jgi:hypothetical protein
VNKLGAEPRESVGKSRGACKSDIKSYNCGEAGHIAREFRKPRNRKISTQVNGTGAEDRPPDRSKPSIGSVHVIGSGNRTAAECIRVHTDISNGRELSLLVDTGEDVSLLKPDNLDKTRKFDPDGRVRVKSVDGSIIETFGAVQTIANVYSLKIPFTFQLVSKQVDIPCDGIVGRDFLEYVGAQICYASGTLTLRTGGSKISKTLSPINAENKTNGIRILVLPSRTELMVRLPVKEGTHIREGVTEKQGMHAYIHTFTHTHTHTHIHIPWINKCVTKIIGSATSHKVMNKHNLYGVKHHKHFKKQCCRSSLHIKKIICTVKGVCI